MSPAGNAVLGMIFLVAGAASTFLMYHLWKYPFDHETYTSTAPPSLMRLHRWLGYVYGAIYLYMLTEMVPRLWTYQIEFPARTVAHLTLGMTIGVLLLVKVSIVRYFKHLESSLVPFLGTALFLCTVLLIGLSAPFAFRAAHWGQAALLGELYSEENLQRIREHLVLAGLEDEERLSQLASTSGLQAGQHVLSNECVVCHDLRTVLARPRTPQSWRQTVERMADRSTILAPISEEEQWEVTAYLIAISPELQKSVRQRRQQEQQVQQSEEAVSHLIEEEVAEEAAPPAYDAERARRLFQAQCALCHPLEVVESAPPQNKEEARALVARMVGNGLQATEEELATIIRYLSETYAP